jgi:hypothetical protein
VKNFVLALASLLASFASVQAQKPSAADTAALIEMTRATTLAYSASLPDFVCTEVISRYRQAAAFAAPSAQVKGRASGGAGTLWEPWQSLDKLTVKLTYFQQQEEHRLMMVDGKPTILKYDSLSDGAITSGEFGGILKSIFDPTSQTSFLWERWKTDRGRRIAIFAYKVAAVNSDYSLENRVAGSVRRALVGYHGTLEIDSETGRILHVYHSADGIPRKLEVTALITTIDYDFAEIAGQRYLLPARSKTEIRSTMTAQSTESEFREYGKFDASSSVNFGKGK